MIPEPNLGIDALGITLIAEVDVEFRGRISNQIVFNTTTINQGIESVPFDIEESQDDLRNKLLTGAYVPMTSWPISIGNIGSSVTSDQIIGLTFRRTSDMTEYEIKMYADTIYGATKIE